MGRDWYIFYLGRWAGSPAACLFFIWIERRALLLLLIYLGACQMVCQISPKGEIDDHGVMQRGSERHGSR